MLKVIEHMEPAIGSERVALLVRMRDRLAQCMESAEKAGRAFSREWGSLADQLGRWDPSLREAGNMLHVEDDP